MGKIILIGSQKGGVGKSTIAINLATAFVLDNKDVLLLDTDYQETSKQWIDIRNEDQTLKNIPCVLQNGNIAETLKDLVNRYEYVIVDVAGRDSKEMRTAMCFADLVITPFRASQPDISTIPYIYDMIKEAKSINPKLQTYAILSSLPTNSNKEAEEVITFLDQSNIQHFDTNTYNRKEYREVMGYGKSVLESSNKKAKEEIQNLYKEVIEIIQN